MMKTVWKLHLNSAQNLIWLTLHRQMIKIFGEKVLLHYVIITDQRPMDLLKGNNITMFHLLLQLETTPREMGFNADLSSPKPYGLSPEHTYNRYNAFHDKD